MPKGKIYKSGYFIMNKCEDANLIYIGGKRAIESASWKYKTQLFEMNHLLETAKLQREIKDGTYKPEAGRRFIINERGKIRDVISISCRDKAVNHVICDNVLTPMLDRYLIYDNSSSRVGKGTKFHRERLEQHLHEYYRKYGNKGYILLGDFRKYYASIDAVKATNKIILLLDKTGELTASEISQVEKLLHLILGEDIGINIGGQPSQNVGITYAYRVDNYVQTVCSQRWYARYSDDFRVIHPDRDYLLELLEGIKETAAKEGLTVHPNKTHVARLDEPFTHLQISYRLSDTGKIIKRIKPKAVKRERDRLKALKRLLDAGRISEDDIENAFKSWLMENYKVMSVQQIQNINNLYQELFRRKIAWKNSRLRYLTEVNSQTWR